MRIKKILPFILLVFLFISCEKEDFEIETNNQRTVFMYLPWSTNLTNLCIDKVQAGLGCEDSWGRIARPEYLVPYADYEFTFIMMPVKHEIGVE